MLTTFPASAPDDGNHRAQWQQLLSRLTPEARQQIEGFRTIVGRNGKWILDQYATVKKLWDEHLPGTSLDEFLGGTNVLQAVAQCQKLGRDGKTAAKKLHEGPWKLDHLTLVQNFEADMATSTRFLQLLVDFSKLTENFDLALAFICKARDLRTKSIGLHRGTHRDKPWQPSDVSTGIATFKVQLNVPSKRKRKHFEESGDAKWAASEGLRLENKRRQWDIKDAGLVQEAEDTELMQEADTVQAQEADQKPNGPITIPRSPSVEMGRGKIEGPITPSISDFASLGGVSDDDDEDEDENEYENEPSTQLGGSLPYLGNDGTTEYIDLTINDNISDPADHDSDSTLLLAMQSLQGEGLVSSTAICDILAAFEPLSDEWLVLGPTYEVDIRSRLTLATTKVLVILHHKMTTPHHWTAAYIKLSESLIELYDPLSLETVREDAVRQIHVLLEGLGREWNIYHNMASPRQPNSRDCGIFVLVVSICKLWAIPEPPVINGSLWRKIFSSLFGPPLESVDIFFNPVGPKHHSLATSAATGLTEQQHMLRAATSVFMDSMHATSATISWLRQISQQVDVVLHILSIVAKKMTYDEEVAALAKVKEAMSALQNYQNLLDASNDVEAALEEKAKDMASARGAKLLRRAKSRSDKVNNLTTAAEDVKAHCTARLMEAEEAQRSNLGFLRQMAGVCCVELKS
ncbi:hypothetical protein H2203_009270 [Taxawa tesnikishii (nom. ined.)]|nr:hypothetical protein H2203_009270 [Dothideales sp. JES 119]